MVLYQGHSVRQLGTEPLNSFRSGGSLFCRRIHAESLHETVAVPYFVAESGTLFYLGLIVEDVVTCAGAEKHTDSHGIGAIGLDKIQRIGAVAKGLGHLAAYLVADDAGEIHVGERLLAHELLTRHYHAGHPKENDVRAGHEVVGGIIICKILIGPVVRMAGLLRVENRDWPEP